MTENVECDGEKYDINLLVGITVLVGITMLGGITVY